MLYNISALLQKRATDVVALYILKWSGFDGIMTSKFQLDGIDYSFSDLTVNGKALVQHLAFSNERLAYFDKQLTILNKAKKAYIEELENDIVQSKSGIDLDGLFDEEW